MIYKIMFMLIISMFLTMTMIMVIVIMIVIVMMMTTLFWLIAMHMVIFMFIQEIKIKNNKKDVR